MSNRSITPAITGDMRSELFTHEVSRVARTLGRNDDVDVVFAGNEARTDGSKIYLPALPQGTVVKQDTARGLRGYADHETFGVRKTDPKAWELFLGAGRKANEEWQNMADVVEDMRVERYGLMEYPGAQKNIAALLPMQEKQMVEALKEDPSLASDKLRATPMAVALEGRRRMGTDATTCESMLAKLDPSIVANAKRYMDAVEKLPDGKAGTEQSIRLAASILEDLSSEEKPDHEDEGDGAGGGGRGKASGGDDGAGSGGASGDDDYDPDKKDEFDPDKITHDHMRQGGKGAGGGVMGVKEGDPADLATAVDMLEALKRSGEAKTANTASLSPDLSRVAATAIDEVRRLARHETGRDPYLIMDPENDAWHTRTSKTYYTRTLNSGVAGWDASTKGTAAQVSVMRRKLERLIMAKQRRDWDVARESGFLDPKRLTQAAMGSRNVHRVKIDKPEIDTAVCILIDLSGSMGGSKCHLAQNVAIALAQCLNTIGADFAIYGFSNTVGHDGDTDARGTSDAYHKARVKRRERHEAMGERGKLEPPRRGWGRTEPLDMLVFKEFGDSLRDAKPSLGAIAKCVGGNNSDADALYAAWNQLRLRPAQKRLMITLSDGSPAWSTSFDVGTLTKEAVRSITSQGCEMAGVGILDESVKEYYPTWSVASSLDEFAGKTMDILAKLMLGDRVRVSR